MPLAFGNGKVSFIPINSILNEYGGLEWSERARKCQVTDAMPMKQKPHILADFLSVGGYRDHEISFEKNADSGRLGSKS